MSQLNIIEPVSPAAANAAQGVASNLNQGADRAQREKESKRKAALEAAGISAQSRIAQARIKSEEEMSKAQIQAAAERQSEELANRSSEYQKLRDATALEGDKQRAAKEAEYQAQIKRQDELIEKQRQVDTEVNGVYTSMMKSSIEEAKAMEAELEPLRKDAEAAEQEMAALMLKEAKGKVSEEQISAIIEGGAAEAAKADMQVRQEAAQSTADAIQVTLKKAVENEPGFGRRVRENMEAVDAEGVVGPLDAIIGINAATIRAVYDSAGNYLGMDPTNVRKNALTDTTAMVMGSLVELADESRMQALLEGSGDYQKAKGALLSLGDAVLRNVAAHQGESGDTAANADQRLEAAVAEAKKYIPEQALKGVFETFTKLEKTPGISEALEKAQGAKSSTNWKAANEEALRLTRLVGYAFDRATSKQGSPAYIRNAPADPRAIFARHAGSLALLEDSPEAFLGALKESGIGPKKAVELLGIAQEMAKDAASAGKVAQMRAAVEARVKSITEKESGVLGRSKRRTGERQLELIGGAQERLGSQGLSLPVDRVLGVTGE